MMINDGEQTAVKWQENAVFHECLSEGENNENLFQMYGKIIFLYSKLEWPVSCCDRLKI
jgi:hypothetical protein